MHPVWITVNVPADAGFAAGPWQERSIRLYAIAAEVAKALGEKP